MIVSLTAVNVVWYGGRSLAESAGLHDVVQTTSGNSHLSFVLAGMVFLRRVSVDSPVLLYCQLRTCTGFTAQLRAQARWGPRDPL
jgi:hypothetical protein